MGFFSNYPAKQQWAKELLAKNPNLIIQPSTSQSGGPSGENYDSSAVAQDLVYVYDKNKTGKGAPFSVYRPDGTYIEDRQFKNANDFNDQVDSLAPLAGMLGVAATGGALASYFGAGAGAAGAGAAGAAEGAAGAAGASAAGEGAGGASWLAQGFTDGGTAGGALDAGYASGSAGTPWTGLGSAGSGAASGAGGSMSDWGNWANLGGNVLNSYLGYKAAGDASDAQIAAMQQAMALQEPFRQGGLKGLGAQLDLYGLSGNTKAPNYGAAMRDPTFKDLQIDPVYQFRQAEGEKAIQRAASAAGRSDSGRAYKDLARFNQGLASEEGGNAWNRYTANQNRKVNYLQSLTGSGQTATNQVGGYLGQQGDARASGYMGQANAVAGGVNNGLNYLNWQNTLSRMGR